AAVRKEFESKGAKVLFSQAWAENTLWSKKPIIKADDVKGLKIRAVPLVSDAIQKLGATPVALTWPDALEGLQRGVIDAMTSAPFDSGVHGGAFEVAPYGTDLGRTGIFAVASFGLSLDRYNRLSEKHRRIIDEVAALAPKVGVEANDKSVDAAADKLCNAKKKLHIHLFSPEETAKVHKLAATTMQADWVKRVKTEVKIDGQPMLDEFIGYIRNYEKVSTYVPGFERYMKKCGAK
ncbi:MAG: TRAP transporter substrate-binding protein DctP, partial [Hyphomicrobiaceae bacterium]